VALTGGSESETSFAPVEPRTPNEDSMRQTVALLLALSSSACFSVHSVEEWDGAKPAGIPFYAARGAWKQTTTYTVTWLELSLARLGDEANPIAVFLLGERGWDRAKAMEALQSDDPAAALRQTFDKALFSPDQLAAGLHAEERRLSDDVPLTLTLIGNTVEPIAVPDYDQRYAFNVRVPFIGSASSMLELASDGTLRKGEAKLDTTKLADVLPISDLLTTAFGLGLTESTDDHQLSLREKGFVYTFTKRLPWETPPQEPLAFDTKTIPFTRAPLDAGAKPKPKPGKAIEFDGTILVPEETK
jgi:hypothetical protein